MNLKTSSTRFNLSAGQLYSLYNMSQETLSNSNRTSPEEDSLSDAGSASASEELFGKHSDGSTYDDYLVLPSWIDFSPTDEEALTSPLSKKLKLNIPLVSTPMDTLTEAQMATRIALLGGIGIIQHNCSTFKVNLKANQVGKVKKSLKKDAFIHQHDSIVSSSPTNTAVRDVIEVKKKSKSKSKSKGGFGGIPTPITENNVKLDLNIVTSKKSKENDLVLTGNKKALLVAHTNLPATTKSASDPVFMEDEQFFFSLILKERSELERRKSMLAPATRSLLGQGQDKDEDEDGVSNNNNNNNNNFNYNKLGSQLRHSLLSWMLEICEHQMCQDETFPLASIMLDKFLLFHAPLKLLQVDQDEGIEEIDDEEEKFYLGNIDQIEQRQLHLFAACCLLLATKLRQTPRLCIEALIEFSKDVLPVELTREEILDGELLVLVTLKWDLAALVTPNDFLNLLMRKCSNKGLFEQCNDNFQQIACETEPDWNNNNHQIGQNQDNKWRRSDEALAGALVEIKCEHQEQKEQLKFKLKLLNQQQHQQAAGEVKQEGDRFKVEVEVEVEGVNNTTTRNRDRDRDNNRCDEFRVRRHTQKLLELCLMDSRLSQLSPSNLAMASMAVAINGLSTTNKTCWRLEDIVKQIYMATHKVNELKQMIDVALQIEKYVQKLKEKLGPVHDD